MDRLACRVVFVVPDRAGFEADALVAIDTRTSF
jgi:hypothetical protein